MGKSNERGVYVVVGSGHDLSSKGAARYSMTQIDWAWNLVAPHHDWRSNIKALVVCEEADATMLAELLACAVEHHTATGAAVTCHRGPKDGQAALLVVAAGYRAGPAGDR